MKTLKYIIVFTLLIASGCEGFLDNPPKGMAVSSSFPKTSGDAVLAINAVYGTLRLTDFNYGLFPIYDIMSDDAHKGSNPGDARTSAGSYENFTHIATEGSIANWWNTLYLGIKRANVVIEYVPPIEMEQILKDRIVGEAYFLRALFYFDLVRGFGDVPKVTSVNTEPDLQRAPKAEILTMIEEDLAIAITNLGIKSSYSNADLGRATKGAAQALLAKVHLWQSEFTEAESYAMQVIQSNQYSLELVFNDANSEAGEFGVESVFEVGGVGEENYVLGGNQYANVQGVRGSPNRGWGFNRPSQSLRDAFESGDPRLEATILELGEVIDGITILGDGSTPDVGSNGYVYPDFPDGIVEIEAYNQKVWTPGTNVPTQFGHNRRLIRYADVLLMAAEALNENNKPTEAKEYLNQVRSRVGLDDFTTNDKDDLREIIFNERRVELALEGHRFWDLIRTGRAVEVLGPYGFQANKHELLAIPQSERDLAGLSQNIGWD